MAMPTEEQLLKLEHLDRELLDGSMIKVLKYRNEYLRDEPLPYYVGDSEKKRHFSPATNNSSEPEAVYRQRVEKLERKMAQMDEYIIGTSKRFTALTRQLEQLQQQLEEEKQNRLRDNSNWGAF